MRPTVGCITTAAQMCLEVGNNKHIWKIGSNQTKIDIGLGNYRLWNLQTHHFLSHPPNSLIIIQKKNNVKVSKYNNYKGMIQNIANVA